MNTRQNLFQRYISKIKQKKLPVADISHHRNHCVDEATDLEKWRADEINPHAHYIQTSPEKMFVDPFTEMSDNHASNLNTTDKLNIHSYITGGADFKDAKDPNHTSGSSNINKKLIESHNTGGSLNKNFDFNSHSEYGKKKVNIDQLDSAISKNKLEKHLVTYSGIGFNPRDIMDSRKKIHLPAYTSSSVNSRIAHMYARKTPNNEKHILRITHPVGSTGMFVGHNPALTPYSDNEHISPRKMTISVNPTPVVHIDDNTGCKLHIWHATRDE